MSTRGRRAAARPRRLIPSSSPWLECAWRARRSTHNWAIQLSGVKHFVFCEPGALSGATTEFDAFDHDLDATRFESAIGRCFRVVVRPGDLIYWPSRWWHQTHNGEMGHEEETPQTAAPVLSVGVSGMAVDVRKRVEFARLVKRRGAPPETAACLPR